MIERMSLDFAECDRARLARDAAYDGRFYTGVRTTGIYCRPVCPVRPARSANVSFFPSAAAAETAGFRPCLRCRPETAPFSSAWIGSLTTVERALRLIVEEGALDREGATVERLAQRLGMGSRQLTRLFAHYLQASPLKVARTARVQRAKRLLNETSLPMAEIAMRAGFGSLRRFNSVFAEVYGRPPSEIRRRRRQSREECKDEQDNMPKGYWVGRVDVINPQGYRAYGVALAEVLRKYGAKFLVRGGTFEAVEGKAPTRNIVLEFKDHATALACYRSPEYTKAKALRTGAVEIDIIVIEGYDGPQPTD